MDRPECPFCSIEPKRFAFSSDHGGGIWDAGHLLVVVRRHASTWDELTDDEKAWAWSAIDDAIAAIRSRHSPDAFHVGFNVGPAASQTVSHFHLHVIPQYSARGGDANGSARQNASTKPNFLASGVTTNDDPQRLVKGDDDPLLAHLIMHMDEADTCDIAVAFLLDSGARRIYGHLEDFLNRGGTARILVGDYLDVTEPIALRRLKDLKGNLSLRVYETQTKAFHLKSYLFMNGFEGIAFVGSSNLSGPALTSSIEWNYKVLSSRDTRGFREIRDGFETLFGSPASAHASEEWIAAYEQRRKFPVLGESTVAVELPEPKPQPHAIQNLALTELERTREDGFSAGLVVLATGLGKTWLAAFDSDRPEFRRILFIAHREEILNQAILAFRRLRPEASIGRFAGETRQFDSDLIFGSVQTLGRQNHLLRFRPDDFDYIIIDEFHHAAADSYRRIIDYFRPKFLLGLTATPDRTDGADLLAFCQENLVFEANIREGIEGGHLCPFRYFGVADDVDYSNIPWRNAQFDLTELTAAIATEARARNALEQLRKHGGSRCIAFCCSQRHADFMAEFFSREGIKAVAVHSGPASAARATSLERLRQGDVEVIFAVDMFNEGVDVPLIDTVLMLRPTESAIIWLQQIGRGLRIADGKDRLVIIDYIGNHRAFLMKLRGMAVVLGRGAESNGRQREILEAIRDERLTLPAGCEVTYETTVIDILQHLLRPTRTEEAMQSFYRDFEERNGVRPLAVETFHAGLNPRGNSERSWLRFVERMGGLNIAERAVWSASSEFFVRLERTEMSRSYKIVLLQAMLDGDTAIARLPVKEIARRVSALATRVHRIADDFSVDLSNLDALGQLLIENPIEAFVGARGMGNVPYFKFDGVTFGFAFDVSDAAAFGALLREVLDWRLAQYLSRGQVTSDVVCRISRNASGHPILFLPARNSSTLPEGPLDVEVDGRPMEAVVAKGAVNVVRAQGGSDNELPSILRQWLGPDAGLPGRSDRVRFRKTDTTIIMEPFGHDAKAETGLKLWERYSREAIPAAFGLTFSQAIWNVGFVVSLPHIFLLVTLAKEDMNSDHQYTDHFLSDQEFNWQSQKRTAQQSNHGHMLREHAARGIRVHLFVRPSKKTGQKPTPFTYCGEVDFVSWEGDRPITVRWRLKERVPPGLHTILKVPG